MSRKTQLTDVGTFSSLVLPKQKLPLWLSLSCHGEKKSLYGLVMQSHEPILPLDLNVTKSLHSKVS